MFQFPAFASYPYEFRIRYLYRHLETKRAFKTRQIFQVSKVGFPIRKSTDQRVFAPPRGLSQRITSFIACACQGIHQSPLRHLIILIANAHPGPQARTALTERPASRDLLGGPRLSDQSQWPGMSVPDRRTAKAAPEQIFSSRCHAEQAADHIGRKLFSNG